MDRKEERQMEGKGEVGVCQRERQISKVKGQRERMKVDII